MSKLTKLLNYFILFSKDACKNHNVKTIDIAEKQLFEKVEVTPHPEFKKETNDTLKEVCKNNRIFLYPSWIYIHSDILISKSRDNVKRFIDSYKNYQLKITKEQFCCLRVIKNHKKILSKGIKFE
jgi:hypothetical protein